MSKRLDKLKLELIEKIEQFAEAAVQESTDNAIALDICRERIRELEAEREELLRQLAAPKRRAKK